MDIYRGSSSKDFEVKKHIQSRYGFNALFFTSSIELARMYAVHHAQIKGTSNGGFVYEFFMPRPRKVIDYNFGITYSRHFRNMIYELHAKKWKSVIIANCYDSPSEKTKKYIINDLVVLFDLDLIKGYKRIESNVKK